MKMAGCSAINCRRNSRYKCRFFRFPRDPVRRQQWIDNCKRGGDWKPNTSSRLCERHFEENQYENRRQDGLKKLKMNAVPTLFDFFSPLPQFERKPVGRIFNVIMPKSTQSKFRVTDNACRITSNSIPQDVTGKENSLEEVIVTNNFCHSEDLLEEVTIFSENSNQSEDEILGSNLNQSTPNSISSCIDDHDKRLDDVTLPSVDSNLSERMRAHIGNTSNRISPNLSSSLNANPLEERIVTLPFLSNFVYKDSYSFEEVKPLLMKLRDLHEENRILRNENISLLNSLENVDS